MLTPHKVRNPILYRAVSCTVLYCSILYRTVTMFITVSRCTVVTSIFYDFRTPSTVTICTFKLMAFKDHLMACQNYINVDPDYF